MVFLKSTQLIVGWVTAGWDFRGICNAIAADNALDYHRITAVAQGISRQLSHAPKAISSPGWTSPNPTGRGPTLAVLVASTDLTPVQHLSWTEVGGKIEHSISVVVQQVPSKGEQSLPLTPYLCSCEHSQGCSLPTLLPVESTLHCRFMLSLKSTRTPRPFVAELLSRQSVPRLLCYLVYVCGGLEDYFSNSLELAWLGILWTWCNILQNTQRKFRLL